MLPFGVLMSKIMDFKENDLFQENEQNEHISVKLQIPIDFQKRVSYRLQFLHRKLPIFSEITDSKEIKEITDFNQFSRDSLLPFSVK